MEPRDEASFLLLSGRRRVDLFVAVTFRCDGLYVLSFRSLHHACVDPVTFLLQRKVTECIVLMVAAAPVL